MIQTIFFVLFRLEGVGSVGCNMGAGTGELQVPGFKEGVVGVLGPHLALQGATCSWQVAALLFS